MATQVLTNAFVLLNAVDLSNHTKQVEVPEGVDAQDATAMGADTKINKPGLRTGSFKATFFQDYAAGSVDATLSGFLNTNPPSTFTIEVRPTTGARSATNPAWVATVFLGSYNPVAGTVGDMQTCEAEFVLASSIQRLTA